MAARLFVSSGRRRSVVVIDVGARAVVQEIHDVGTRPWGIGVSPVAGRPWGIVVSGR
jgi:YVTN family beta-propeller protein